MHIFCDRLVLAKRLSKTTMNMGNAQILDKAQGALIGSALGDAIGIFTVNAARFKENFDNLTISMAQSL